MRHIQASSIATIARSLSLITAMIILVSMAVGPVGAHDDGTTAHLWGSHFKPLATPGTINTATNPVDWTKLKGVPADFADGVDHIARAAFGLNEAYGYLWVDANEVQKRVVGACGPGRSIKSIAKDGSVDCNPGPRGFSKTTLDTGIICNAGCTEGTLDLSLGLWAISAKITLIQTDIDEDRLWGECWLVAGGETDRSLFKQLGDSSGVTFSTNPAYATVPLQLVAKLTEATGTNASLACSDGDIGDVKGRNLSIMGIRLGE